MEERICNICRKSKPITRFGSKGKKKRRGHCKVCGRMKKRGLVKWESPALNPNFDIRIRGIANKKKFASVISYEKAQKLVDDGMAKIVHPTLIHKLYDYKEFRKTILRRDHYKCYYCNKLADTIDHVIPKSHGGISSFTNCVACCKDCNVSKSNLHLKRFLYLYEPFQWIQKSQEDYAIEKIEDINSHLEIMNKYLSIHLAILSNATNRRKYKQIRLLKKKVKRN